jgi:hypothetical protein
MQKFAMMTGISLGVLNEVYEKSMGQFLPVHKAK